MPYYGVNQGRTVGVFRHWYGFGSAKASIDGLPDSKQTYKKFADYGEAIEYVYGVEWDGNQQMVFADTYPPMFAPLLGMLMWLTCMHESFFILPGCSLSIGINKLIRCLHAGPEPVEAMQPVAAAPAAANEELPMQATGICRLPRRRANMLLSRRRKRALPAACCSECRPARVGSSWFIRVAMMLAITVILFVVMMW